MTYKVNEPFHPICFAYNKDTSMCVALFLLYLLEAVL